MSVENEGRRFSEIRPFIDWATSVGCYSGGQVSNNTGVLAVLEKAPPAPDMTVGELKQNIDAVLNTYAATSKVSHDSVLTYRARAIKLLDEFIKWNGGDVVAWKKEIAASGGGARPRKSKAKPRESIMDTAPIVNGVIGYNGNGQRHTIRLSGGRTGELMLPAILTGPDIETIWKQLTALKGLVEAQAEVLAAEDPDA